MANKHLHVKIKYFAKQKKGKGENIKKTRK